MAGNGGIIGPVNTVTAATCVAEKKTTFTSSGCLTAQATANIDYMVIAGGGGGAGSGGGSGAGAGGYRASTGGPAPTNGCAVPVIACTTYTVTVGRRWIEYS